MTEHLNIYGDELRESYLKGVKAEHERVKECIKLTEIGEDTLAVIDMMQFEYPEKCPKKEAIVTGIWERGE